MTQGSSAALGDGLDVFEGVPDVATQVLLEVVTAAEHLVHQKL